MYAIIATGVNSTKFPKAISLMLKNLVLKLERQLHLTRF